MTDEKAVDVHEPKPSDVSAFLTMRGMDEYSADELQAMELATALEQAPRTTKDGFRKPRKRGKGWLAKAIKNGEVRDPALGPLPDEEHPAGTHIIDVPVMTVDGSGTKE